MIPFIIFNGEAKKVILALAIQDPKQGDIYETN
jgi:hypothetical protein